MLPPWPKPVSSLTRLFLWSPKWSCLGPTPHQQLIPHKVNQITPPLCSKPRDSLIQLEFLQEPYPPSTLLSLAPCSFSDTPGHLLFPLRCSSPRYWHSFCSHLIQVFYSDISVTTLTTLFPIPAILLLPLFCLFFLQTVYHHVLHRMLY